MLYTVIGTDIENSLDMRLKLRADHRAHIESLKTLGRLIIAGPRPAIDSENPGPNGYTGSVIIAEFDSLDDAQAWANADPYFINGVFSSVEVKPFQRVLP